MALNSVMRISSIGYKVHFYFVILPPAPIWLTHIFIRDLEWVIWLNTKQNIFERRSKVNELWSIVLSLPGWLECLFLMTLMLDYFAWD